MPALPGVGVEKHNARTLATEKDSANRTNWYQSCFSFGSPACVSKSNLRRSNSDDQLRPLQANAGKLGTRGQIEQPCPGRLQSTARWNFGELGWRLGIKRDKMKDQAVLHWNGPKKPWMKEGLSAAAHVSLFSEC